MSFVEKLEQTLEKVTKGESGWGLFMEGPIRKQLRELTAELLNVPGSKRPFIDAILRKRRRR